MSYALAIRLAPEPVRSLAFGAISGAYMGIGTAFSHPIRIIMIQNLTDVSLMFSFDGVDDHVPLPGSGFLLLDVSTNKGTSNGFYIAEGTRIYVRDLGAPATVGSVYVSVFYADGGGN